MNGEGKDSYEFGRGCVDPAQQVVWEGDQLVPVQPMGQMLPDGQDWGHR